MRFLLDTPILTEKRAIQFSTGGTGPAPQQITNEGTCMYKIAAAVNNGVDLWVSPYILPYSGKLSREKTFANFAVLWLYAKVFSMKFGAWRPLARQKRAIHESFLRENHIFHQFASFLPRKFPAIQYTVDLN